MKNFKISFLALLAAYAGVSKTMEFDEMEMMETTPLVRSGAACCGATGVDDQEVTYPFGEYLEVEEIEGNPMSALQRQAEGSDSAKEQDFFDEQVEEELRRQIIKNCATQLEDTFRDLASTYKGKAGHVSTEKLAQVKATVGTVSHMLKNHAALLVDHPIERRLVKKAFDKATAQVKEVHDLLTAGNSSKSWKGTRSASNVSAVNTAIVGLQDAQQDMAETLFDLRKQDAALRAEEAFLLEQERTLEEQARARILLDSFKAKFATGEYYCAEGLAACNSLIRNDYVSLEDKEVLQELSRKIHAIRLQVDRAYRQDYDRMQDYAFYGGEW